MTTMWWSGAEITRTFAVAESKLAAYARRGDLPRRRGPDGVVRYSLEVINDLFPRRGSAALEERTGESMAVLGSTKLGDATPAAAEVKLLSRPPQPAPARTRELRSAIGE